MKYKITLIVSLALSLPAAAQSGAASGNMGMAKAMDMKFESRLDAVNSMLSNLESRLSSVNDFRIAVSRCYAQGKFYQPGDSGADARGCVGAALVDVSGRHNIYISAGGCDGGTTYKIPKSLISKMDGGKLYTHYEKMSTRTLDFIVGHSTSRKYKKKVDSSLWNDKHCIVTLTYDGANTITTHCRGDGSKRCNNNEIRYIDWSGSKLQIGEK